MKIKYIGKYTKDSKKLHKYISKNHPEYLTEENPELIVVAGGDGTMLNAIKNHSNLNIPFFGIGMGTLNFLMNDIGNPKKLMRTIINKKPDFISARSMSVKVIRDGEIIYSGLATNDIMLGNGIMDYHHFRIDSEDHSFNKKDVFGQSLIVSTAIGSTAISYNNKVPAIPALNLDLLSISTVLSSVDTVIKKMIHSKQKTKIKILSKRQDCKLFVDGMATIIDLERKDTVVFSRGKKIEFAFLDYEEFEIKRLN